MISGMSVGTTTLNTVVDADAVLLAVLFSAGVGLFFGSYPANCVAGLHPIDAFGTNKLRKRLTRIGWCRF